MATVSTSFTGVGASSVLVSQQESENITVSISGTYNMTIRLERAVTSDESAWEVIKTWTTANATVDFVHRTVRKGDHFRLNVTVDNSGTAVTTLSDEDEEHQVVKNKNGVSLYTVRESGLLYHQRAQHDLDVGTPGTNVTAKHYSADGINFTSVLTLSSVAVTIGDLASLAYGALIYTMPSGDIAIKACAISVGLTGAGTPTTDTPEVGIGTVIASGAVSALGGTATFEDILEGQAMANIAGTAKVFLDQRPMDMLSAGAHTIHINGADAFADLTSTSATFSGTVTLSWSKLPLS